MSFIEYVHIQMFSAITLFVWNLSDGHIHAMSAPVPDETNLMGFMHRVVDFEESDRETMHLLVFLLMQFLSRSDQVIYNYVHPCLSVTKNKKNGQCIIIL